MKLLFLDDKNKNSNYEVINDGQFKSSTEYPVVVAKFDYTQRTDDDLSFKKGELLYILDSDNDDWWLAKNRSNVQGFIPSNHVMEHNSIEAQK